MEGIISSGGDRCHRVGGESAGHMVKFTLQYVLFALHEDEDEDEAVPDNSRGDNGSDNGVGVGVGDVGEGIGCFGGSVWGNVDVELGEVESERGGRG